MKIATMRTASKVEQAKWSKQKNRKFGRSSRLEENRRQEKGQFGGGKEIAEKQTR